MEGEQGRGLGDVGSPPRAACNLVSFPSTDTLCSQETHWLELAWWGGAELIVDWSMERSVGLSFSFATSPVKASSL
ncbi:unnamed protein product [Arctogadus glacialis]